MMWVYGVAGWMRATDVDTDVDFVLTFRASRSYEVSGRAAQEDPEARAMSEFGQELRRERESRGIGLDSIINATKISSRHLTALEGNQFDHLPGGVFNKGIVRGYARVVGLNEEEWVTRFMSAYQGSGKVKDDDVSWMAFAENVGKTRVLEVDSPVVHVRWAGVAMLVVLLVVLGLFVWHFVGNRASETSSGPQVTATAG
jgi:cytoskeletal protein RodZ